MNLNPESVKQFRSSVEVALPGLIEALDRFQGDVYLIGASVFELYAANGWCEELSRSTSDLDFTLELDMGAEAYQQVCADLVAQGYSQDDEHLYRYHSPAKIGRYLYVDLLAFPTVESEATQARNLMGAGENFSFEGMDFAREAALGLWGKVYVPNPLAFLYLKMVAYYENPDIRRKDFVDIFELVVGSVKKKVLFVELRALAKQSQFTKAINYIQRVIKAVAQDSNPRWDYEQVSNLIHQTDPLMNYDHEELKGFFEIFSSEVF